MGGISILNSEVSSWWIIANLFEHTGDCSVEKDTLKEQEHSNVKINLNKILILDTVRMNEFACCNCEVINMEIFAW